MLTGAVESVPLGFLEVWGLTPIVRSRCFEVLGMRLLVVGWGVWWRPFVVFLPAGLVFGIVRWRCGCPLCFGWLE